MSFGAFSDGTFSDGDVLWYGMLNDGSCFHMECSVMLHLVMDVLSFGTFSRVMYCQIGRLVMELFCVGIQHHCHSEPPHSH